MPKKDKALTFEEAMQKLEECVEKLEAGDLGLDASLKVYEEGVGLTKFCEESLKKAKGRLEEVKK